MTRSNVISRCLLWVQVTLKITISISLVVSNWDIILVDFQPLPVSHWRFSWSSKTLCYHLSTVNMLFQSVTMVKDCYVMSVILTGDASFVWKIAISLSLSGNMSFKKDCYFSHSCKVDTEKDCLNNEWYNSEHKGDSVERWLISVTWG